MPGPGVAGTLATLQSSFFPMLAGRACGKVARGRTPRGAAPLAGSGNCRPDNPRIPKACRPMSSGTETGGEENAPVHAMSRGPARESLPCSHRSEPSDIDE